MKIEFVGYAFQIEMKFKAIKKVLKLLKYLLFLKIEQKENLK